MGGIPGYKQATEELKMREGGLRLILRLMPDTFSLSGERGSTERVALRDAPETRVRLKGKQK